MMHQTREPARHVFVYGTLRRGGSNDIARLRPPPQWVGEAVIAATLYDLGAYPGAILGGDRLLRGEVYRIAPALEAALDRLEEVADDDSGEYRKRILRVLVAGADMDCLVYEIHPDRIAGAPIIASGDWFRRR